jgi:co-chaperonin GroES (HSP10)
MIQPKGDYLLVKVKNEELGGIVLSGEKSESQKGEVLDIGQGALDLISGKRTEMFVSKGDTIIWERFANADFSFKENGVEYSLVKISQVMGVENE